MHNQTHGIIDVLPGRHHSQQHMGETRDTNEHKASNVHGVGQWTGKQPWGQFLHLFLSW